MVSPQAVHIVGAGDLGREILGWIRADNSSMGYEIVGFIDDGVGKTECEGLPVLEMAQAARLYPSSSAIVAISSPKDRKDIARRLEDFGLTPFTYIHSTALFGTAVSVGLGSIISPRATLCPNAQIGQFCLVNIGCTIGHDTKIGNFSTLLGANILNGWVEVGESCLLGCGAVVHPKIRIGNDSVVGIGSIVLRNVKAGTTVFGNPARVISA